MGAHGRKSQNISNLNMFLTNGTGMGAPDPQRLVEWNNFVANIQAQKDLANRRPKSFKF